MNFAALIDVTGLEPGDLVNTGGIYYGPHDCLTLIALGRDRIAVHGKGHKQYWSQTEHYIPACVMVFERIDTDDRGRWICRMLWESETGKQARRIKAMAERIANGENPPEEAS